MNHVVQIHLSGDEAAVAAAIEWLGAALGAEVQLPPAQHDPSSAVWVATGTLTVVSEASPAAMHERIDPADPLAAIDALEGDWGGTDQPDHSEQPTAYLSWQVTGTIQYYRGDEPATRRVSLLVEAADAHAAAQAALAQVQAQGYDAVSWAEDLQVQPADAPNAQQPPLDPSESAGGI